MQARVAGLGAGLNDLKGILAAADVPEEDHVPHLQERERVAYGGCRSCATLIEHGIPLLQQAIADREIACVPAVLMRPLIERCLRSHWLLWMACDNAASAFLSDASGAYRWQDYPGLRRLLQKCRKHERDKGRNRLFLGPFGTDPDRLHRLVHGGPNELRGGMSACAASREYPNKIVSDMAFAFGGAMFMAHENIARLVGAGQFPLRRIREHRAEFHDLFFPIR